MAVLETLFLLIKGDSSQLQSETKKVEKESEKLTNTLKQMDGATRQVGDSFLNLAKRLGGLLAVYLSLDAAIGGFRRSIDYAANLDQASKALNVNIETLDAWSNAIRRTGGTAESFQSTLKGFAHQIGTTPERALRILPRLADQFHRLSQFNALNYGKMIGLDEPTILLLQKGRREVDAIIARQIRLGIISKNQAELSRSLNIELGNTSQAFRSLFQTIGEQVIPVMTKFLTVVQDVAIYLRGHANLIIGALIGIGAAAAVVAAPFIAAQAPIIALIAGITALIGIFAVLYEDVTAYFNHQDSLIGRALERFPKLNSAIRGLKSSWEWLTGGGKEATAALHAAQSRLQRIDAGVIRGKESLEVARTSGLNSITTNSILNKSFGGGTSNVNIDSITINTQATDAEGIGNALHQGIKNYFVQSNNNWADGIIA